VHDRVPLENRIRSGDLQVFHVSGSVRVFVDQAVENRFSADLLCADIGHGGAGSGTFVVGDALGDVPDCRRAAGLAPFARVVLARGLLGSNTRSWQ
jgi:hypothetical protein